MGNKFLLVYFKNLTKMKVICLITFIGVMSLLSTVKTTSCSKASYCQACHDTNVNECDGCYSWNNSPRYKSNNVCTTARTTASLVADCEIYTSNATADTKDGGTCFACKGGKVFKATTTANNVWTLTCQDSNATYLKKDSAGCESGATKYKNSANDVATYTQTCNLCAKGKAPATVNLGTWADCTANTAVANCERGSSNSAGNGVGCGICKSGFAAHGDRTACKAWTDKNCMLLNNANDACAECWPAYTFDGAVCVKAAKLLSAALLGLIASLFLN